MIKVFNTLTGEKEEFTPIREGKIGMYVCGITAYDYCHIGHARSLIVFDTIYRYLTGRGYDVRYVRNFTDIDDKILQRAKEEGVSWKEIAERYIHAFREDTAALNLLTPSFEPKASEHIPEMITLIEGLLKKGLAYLSAGDACFRVKNFQPYGSLSKRDTDELLRGARVEVGEQKEDPLDFVLWKGVKPGEPFWESPFGKGRPGWHIECSAMSMKYLGETFDIHGGGQDLIFPHHENEIAQSEGFSGKRFVRYWIHNGFVNIRGEKMSKSLGNFLLIREITKRHHPEALRLFMLSRHYRNPLDYMEEELDTAETTLFRLYSALQEAPSPGGKGEKGEGLNLRKMREKGETLMARFIDAMDDDFNTPRALSLIFDLARTINRVKGAASLSGSTLSAVREAQERLREGGKALGILYHSPEAVRSFMNEEVLRRAAITPGEIEGMIEDRERLRKGGEYEKADAVREILRQKGIILEDTREGTQWRVRRIEGGN